MECADVLERMIALEDGELGPSEEVLVRGHIVHCEHCTRMVNRLSEFVPRPALVVPLAYRARLAKIDGTALLGAAERRPRGWRPASAAVLVPAPAALGYAMLLILSVAWGIANWRERAALEARLLLVPTTAVAAPEIPARDYRPAAWTPEPVDESP